MKKNERFALLGYPLGHSLSPEIHESIFAALGLEASYELWESSPENLERTLRRLLEEMQGFNCTIPYKQKLIPFLESVDEQALLFNSVNTVYEGRGYNTDAAGFMSAGFDYKDSRVLVLGSGGAAQTMIHCVAGAGAEAVFIRSRTPEKLTPLLERLRGLYPHCRFEAAGELRSLEKIHYILNGTPVGMWPESGRLPLLREDYLRLLKQPAMKGVFDAIYNPLATRFVLLARSCGRRAEGGLGMLFNQAVAAERIWHPELKERFDEPETQEKLRQAQAGQARRLLGKFPQKIIFTGFMASGKSTLARLLAERMGRPGSFLDLDEVIERQQRQRIDTIFETEGEAAFRHYEQEALQDLLQRDGSLILATGGGALLSPGAEALVRRNGGLIVSLDVSLEEALARSRGNNERPLLKRGRKAVEALYNRRRAQYLALADLLLDADKSLDESLAFLEQNLFGGVLKEDDYA